MMGLRRYIWSFAVSVVVTALVAVLASLPHCQAFGFVLLPGALLAAVVFPQGPHSDFAVAYLVLAGILESLLIAFPVMWTWALIEQRRKAKG